MVEINRLKIHKYLSDAAFHSNSLKDVQNFVIPILKAANNNGKTSIAYISGIISSDGPSQIQKNITALKCYTDYYRRTQPFPVFSSSDIFNIQIEGKFSATQKEWVTFWNNILMSGFITDLFLTPRWHCSQGAKEEYRTASIMGLKIRDDSNSPNLLRLVRKLSMS